MNMSFSELRKKAADIQSIRDRVTTANTNGGGDGGDFLQLGIDATRNGYIRVRLLPAPEGEESPMVTYSRFYWKNGPKTYSALNLKNIGQSDPCQLYLAQLWEDGSKQCKDLYSERKKQTRTVVNLVVLEDKVKPENNNLVKKYRTPAFIKKLIEQAINPEVDKFTGLPSNPSFNPFDIFGAAGGRDLIIRVTDKEGQNSYEKSHWADNSSALYDGDEEKMEAAWKQAGSLFQYIDPSKHKTFDEAAKYLTEVLGRDDPYLRAALPDWLEEHPEAGRRSGGSKPDEVKTSNKPAEDPAPKTETKTETKSDTPKEESKRIVTNQSDDFDFDFGDDDV